MKLPRWRLFPKYATLIIAVVAGVLVISGAINLVFSWRETQANLVALQVEKAQGAAARIEQFMLDIEHQIGWTAFPRTDNTTDAIEQRRIEYLKLQKQAWAITELVWIGNDGRERLRVSRLAMDTVGAGTDFSNDPAFLAVSARKETWFGPVQFRKDTEPYMAIARPAGGDGGVTVAYVNLKFVWDVVSRIKIGHNGLAYVVDATGTLIAHPDISLVLKKTDMKPLPQVAALERADSGEPVAALDLAGHQMFAAHARIPALNWTVFVESPRAEALAPLRESIMRLVWLLVGGLLLAAAESFVLARALVRPIRALQEGAARIGAGELDQRIQIKTGDELEGLAEQFNKMGSELQASYAGLERKVVERTHELSEALEQQTATADVLRVISESPTDVQPVMEAVAERSRRLCRADGSRVWLLQGDHLRSMTSYKFVDGPESGRDEVLPLKGTSVVGRAFVDCRTVHVPDVAALVDSDYPDTRVLYERYGFRTVLGVPMLREGVSIGTIGVLRKQVQPFSVAEIRLVEIFAAQAVIAIENVRLFNETKEALERQTATAEILRVISGSPTNVQPVLDTVAERSGALCRAEGSRVWLLQGGKLCAMTSYGSIYRDDAREALPLGRGSVVARAFADRELVHVHDVLPLIDTEYPDVRQLQARYGFRTVLAVPMLREGGAVGVITLLRNEVRPFAAAEIALVQAFADQAVIAIENVRLFNETKEALKHQTATAEVLQVIGSSVADTAPVFDKILDSCRQVFASQQQTIHLLGEDGQLRLGASYNSGLSESAERTEPITLAGTAAETAIGERRVIQYPDILGGADVPAGVRRPAKRLGINYALMTAPMLREGRGVGTISIARVPPRPFSDKEMSLLKTFADQAVIAIQNARLFNETKESLERQTATAEILKVIASSPTDVQPVFAVIVESAVRLCGARFGRVYRYDGSLIEMVASHGLSTHGLGLVQRVFPRPAAADTIVGRVILARQAYFMKDVEQDASVPALSRQMIEALGTRSQVTIPILRAGDSIGAITMGWAEPAGFDDQRIALLQTFADQAVIAIENVRLFNETKEALEQQTATAEVLRVISSSVADTGPVFEKILHSCSHLFESSEQGIVLLGDDGRLRLGAHRGTAREKLAAMFPIEAGDEPVARAMAEQRVLHYPDVLRDAEPGSLSRVVAERLGVGSYTQVFAPMRWEGRGVGYLYVIRSPVAPFSDKEIGLLKTFGDQAAIAIQNARLFNEIQTKSRQLEDANRHKSEFLANMSHELRTPLNAIIGFSEVLVERMFGDINDKQMEYLQDIHSSGQHLLALINDVLDLSKIEAGKMELDLSCFDLGLLLDHSATLVRERAQRHGLALELEVDDGLAEWVADARKVKQVVVNLLSNAVKFTPNGGRVSVRARHLNGLNGHAGEWAEVSVSDTGVGIAREDQALVFEEFRQAGGDVLRKAEGTGLGLALVKRFVELHGGEVTLDSEPGSGSTFRFTLPQHEVKVLQ